MSRRRRLRARIVAVALVLTGMAACGGGSGSQTTKSARRVVGTSSTAGRTTTSAGGTSTSAGGTTAEQGTAAVCQVVGIWVKPAPWTSLTPPAQVEAAVREERRRIEAAAPVVPASLKEAWSAYAAAAEQGYRALEEAGWNVDAASRRTTGTSGLTADETTAALRTLDDWASSHCAPSSKTPDAAAFCGTVRSAIYSMPPITSEDSDSPSNDLTAELSYRARRWSIRDVSAVVPSDAADEWRAYTEAFEAAYRELAATRWHLDWWEQLSAEGDKVPSSVRSERAASDAVLGWYHDHCHATGAAGGTPDPKRFCEIAQRSDVLYKKAEALHGETKAEVEAAWRESLALLDEAERVAPDELRGDIAITYDWFRNAAAILEQAGWDWQVVERNNIDPLVKDPRQEAASEAVGTWVGSHCSAVK